MVGTAGFIITVMFVMNVQQIGWLGALKGRNDHADRGLQPPENALYFLLGIIHQY